MVTSQEISDAIAVEKAAYVAYTTARERRESLQVTRACEEYKVGIGMFVTDKRGRKGVVIRVTPWGDMRPWVYAHEIKKDGSRSGRQLSMYGEWTVIAAHGDRTVITERP
jgi:hypothetical protein